jgi:Sporulation and spore germination
MRTSSWLGRAGTALEGVALAGLVLAMGACATSSGPTSEQGGGGSSATATAAASATTAAATATATTAAGYPVKVYFSKHPDSDSSPTAVFPVYRSSPTLGVATYAIEQLIAGPTAAEKTAGYYTELTTSLVGTSSCNGADFTIALDMKGAKHAPGTATLQFCRGTQLAGDLSGARITANISQTLLQFSNITSVVILTQSGHCFNDLKGTDDCLA